MSNPPGFTQAMISPDGQVGDIPVDRVNDAVKSGFKMGVEMTSPDGQAGVIPVDKAHDAIRSGFKPKGATQAAAQMQTEPTLMDKIAAPGKKVDAFMSKPETQAALSVAMPVPAESTVNALRTNGGKVLDAAKGLLKFDPTELHAGIKSVASEASGISSTVSSVRQAFEEAGNAVLAKSKELYSEIDAATKGRWSANEAELKNINMELRDTVGLDETKDAKLLAQKAKLETAQKQMISDMEGVGVDPQTVQAAKQNYKQAQALYDTDSAVKASSVAGKESVPSLSRPETVDPKKLYPRLSKLYDSGRLQEAVGEEGSAKLLGHAEDADILARHVTRNQRIAKWVSGTAGAGAAGGAIVEGIKTVGK